MCGIVLGPWSRGITFHARTLHKLTIGELWLKKQGLSEVPRCACKPGCARPTRWHNWSVGFTRFSAGHYDVNVRSVNTSKALKVSHWSRGKTKDTDVRLALAAEKMSRTLREKIASGAMLPTQLGRTKLNDAGVAAGRLKRMEHYKAGLHPRKLSFDCVVARFNEAFGSKFSFDIDPHLFGDRKNSNQFKVTLTCRACCHTFTGSVQRLMPYNGTVKCPSCERHVSQGQRDIYELIKRHEPGALLSDRTNPTGHEIDVFVPAQRFGVEYHGLFWHSTAYGNCHNRWYHVTKFQRADEHGIRLLQVFEDEWRDRPDIISSMIRARLGVITNKVPARRCVVRKLTPEERVKFFVHAHLDGDVHAMVAFGLVCDNVLVSAMSLRNPTSRKLHEAIEVARHASELDTVVVGGLGKLTRACAEWARSNGFKRMMTYADNRIGSGSAYENVGFAFEGLTQPRIWWTDTVRRFDRVADVPKDDAERNRAFRIYGCQSRVLSYPLA